MRRLGWLLLVCLAGGWDALRTADSDVEQGNQAFREGRYEDALGRYRSAEARGSDARLHFDLGAALYKLGEKSADESKKAELFEQAEEEFRRAADTDDLRLKSSAYYNLGNSLYQRRQWEDAIAAYKRALRADPKSEAARHNLEMALRQRETHPPQKGAQPGKEPPQKGQERAQPEQGQKGQGPEQKPDQPQPGTQGQEKDRQPEGQDQESGESRDEQGGQEPDRSGEEREQEQARGRKPDPPPDPGDGTSDTPSDQDRKLDELERRSRDLRKRLLRQGSRNRDPLRLPSRKDW